MAEFRLTQLVLFFWGGGGVASAILSVKVALSLLSLRSKFLWSENFGSGETAIELDLSGLVAEYHKHVLNSFSAFIHS